MAENSMRDAILSVVEAKGGSAEGVGPLDRDALDRLLDVMAGSDQPVTSGMSDAQVVRALAQYAHGGGGGGQLGPLCSPLVATSRQVAVGGLTAFLSTADISLVKSGGSVIATSNGGINRVALGTTVGITWDSGYSFRLFDVTIVNGGEEVHGEPVYGTAVEVTGAVEAMSETIGEGDDAEVYEGIWVTLPAELADGHDFVLEILQQN